MHYSQLVLALPLAQAVILDRREPAQYADAVVTVQAIETAIATTIVTVTVGAGAAPTGDVKAADNNVGIPQYYDGHHMWSGHGGHAPPSDNHWGHQHHAQYQPAPAAPAQEQPAPAAPVKEQPKPVEQAPPPPPPRKQPSTPQANPPTGGSGAAGCPSDPTSPTSPGMQFDGQAQLPDRSMIDSINEIRRMYNPNAACLKWSPSLATASDNCAKAKNENQLRANSGVVSDRGYLSPDWMKFWKAKTTFENSMYLLLCQLDTDPLLRGSGAHDKCPLKMGEDGCTLGEDPNNPQCTGHRDMIIDAKNENRFMGAACNEATQWMSASFSKTNEIFH